MKTKTITQISTFVFAILPLILFGSIIGTAAPGAASSFSPFSMPQNLGATVNSASGEELTIIAPSGLSLYFTSDRPGGLGGRDIWVSQRATLTSAWGAPQNVAALNTNATDATGIISPDGREMILQSTRPGGIGGEDLYLSTRTNPNDDFGWTTPVNLGAVVNSSFPDRNPNYFVNPATGAGTLFFTSDRSSVTTDVKDVYQSTRNANGSFNAPTLVNELNSAADEQKTVISRDGLEIFVASNRSGSNAILVSTRASVSAAWNPPVPIGSLITGGSAGQPALSPDDTVLYFTSNRTGGSGGPDLYSAVRVSVNRNSTADFDGDGRTDISVFRPSDGTWYVMQSGNNTFRAQQFGTNGDRIVPGDYDGDGRTDFAVFRGVSTSGIWYILQSSDNAFRAVTWGFNTDKPVPGDYDGDGRTDIAVYRDGHWYLRQG